MNSFWKLLKYVKPHWPRYAVALLGVGATSMLEVGKASIFKYIFDGMHQRSWHLVNLALELGVAIMIVESIVNFTKTYMVDTGSNKVALDLRVAMAQKLQRLPLKFFDRNHSGDLMSRFTNDLLNAQNAVGWQLISLIENPLSALIAFIYLATLDFKLALFCLLIGPTTVLAGKAFGKPLRHNAEKTQIAVSGLLTLLTDILASIPVIKSFQMEGRVNSKFLSGLNGLYSLNRRTTLINASLSGTANLLGFISILLTFGLASYKVMHQQMSIGTVLAFTQLMNRLTWPFSNLAGLLGSLHAAMASADRVFAILEEPDELTDSDITPVSMKVDLDKTSTVIELGGIAFSYDNVNPVLTDISLKVYQGETLALVGPSGSGKSSLVKLLLGFYQPTKGNIRIGGIDAHDLGLQRLRGLSSFVPQETILVTGTIEDNIKYGDPDATAEEVVQAAKAANAHNFILELPDGYQTSVGERGVKLSGGQRQRIAIARALLKNPSILLLDEATSALDSESEYLVQEALNVLMKGRTCVVIAHRLSTVRNADRIAVLENGRIAELGSHGELMDLNGLYAAMYNRQFSEDGDEVA